MEFILENPFILIVIFAIISSLFKTKKGNNQNQNSQTKQREARTFQKQQTQSTTVEQRKAMSPLKRLEQMATEMADRLDKEYTEKRKLAESKLKGARDYIPPTEEVKPLQVKVEQPVVIAAVEKPHAPQPSLSIEKQKVIDGVVWAEILGPPRALNPHRTLKKK